MAHAVPMAPHAGGLPGEGEETDRLQGPQGQTLGVFTQWSSFWLLPSSPTPKTPRSGQLSYCRGGLMGKTHQKPARVAGETELGGSVGGN